MSYEIGKQIRKYRAEKRMSQKQLADKLGITNSRVSNWEQGTNRPDADMIGAICKALDISPSDLLDIHLVSEEFTYKEKVLIKAYREKKDLQKAVDILLGLVSNK